MENLLMGLSTLAQTAVGFGLPGGVEIVVVLGIAVFGLLLTVFWIWMIVDCAQREFDGQNDKLVWILVIVLVGALGGLIYFFAGRPRGRLT